jgi:hypothetical protein
MRTRSTKILKKDKGIAGNDDLVSEDELIEEELKKKTFSVSILASCLSIELRQQTNDLIAEFCMVNFDYGFNAFADESMKIYMKAHALFIFHDEEVHLGEKSSTKQVMFGHINA